MTKYRISYQNDRIQKSLDRLRPATKKKAAQVLRLLKENPSNLPGQMHRPGLIDHLEANLYCLWEARLDDKTRMAFDIDEKEKLITIKDVGSHDKVLR